jgi:hypothetical protein
MSELFREALRQYQQKQEAPKNTDLIAALRAMREDARRGGLDKLSQRLPAGFPIGASQLRRKVSIHIE